MKKLSVLIPCFCLALVSFAAKADTLTYNSSPTGNIGPYDLTLGSTDLALFCMNDNRTVNSGESWTVDVILGSQLSTNSLTSGNATKFEEEAYILSELGTYSNTAVQDALWKIFDSGESISGTALALYNAAIGAPGSTFITGGGYDDYVFYIYDGGTIHGRSRDNDSLPQNFIGDPTPTSATPEPSSLFLLGSGLLGLAGAARRKLGRA